MKAKWKDYIKWTYEGLYNIKYGIKIFVNKI